MGIERNRPSTRSVHRGGRYPTSRSSQRSRSSGSSSNDPRTRVKDCCRKLTEFMCTQVGVGGLVVSYAIIGSFVFMELERDKPKVFEDILILRNVTLDKLWSVTSDYNVLHHRRWSRIVNHTIQVYQQKIIEAIKEGYDPNLDSQTTIWSFAVALMFCLSVFTMIGYGKYVPRTDWGKAATIIYAIFGIPLYVLYLMNMGKVFAGTFKYLYAKLYLCQIRKPKIPKGHYEGNEGNKSKGKGVHEAAIYDGYEDEPEVLVPTTACLWVMIAYIAGGTILFAEWEDWSYLDSTYFCATSLLKIGIGDFVPGATFKSQVDSQTKLVINFIFLLLGMGLIAMCYNLMKEEVIVRVSGMKEDLHDRMLVMGEKFGLIKPPRSPAAPR